MAARLAYFQCISASVVSFSSGMAPITAVELGRRGLGTDIRPSAEELEQMLKSLKTQGK